MDMTKIFQQKRLGTKEYLVESKQVVELYDLLGSPVPVEGNCPGSALSLEVAEGNARDVAKANSCEVATDAGELASSPLLGSLSLQNRHTSYYYPDGVITTRKQKTI